MKKPARSNNKQTKHKNRMQNENPPGITPLEMTETDIETAQQAAACLGYEQTAYTSTSAIWGLYCLPENPRQRSGQVTRGGVFLKTAEFGIVFLQTLENLHCQDMAGAGKGAR